MRLELCTPAHVAPLHVMFDIGSHARLLERIGFSGRTCCIRMRQPHVATTLRAYCGRSMYSLNISWFDHFHNHLFMRLSKEALPNSHPLLSYQSTFSRDHALMTFVCLLSVLAEHGVPRTNPPPERRAVGSDSSLRLERHS